MTQNGQVKAKPPIALVVITRDEENNIARCLRSVPWADERLVLDSGSQDRTCAIAQELGARVVIEAWRGYRAQKQRAVELTHSPWVLSLDADEALSPELVAELDDVFASGILDRYDGVEFPRVSSHLGRWIRHGGWYPDHQLRLFRRDRGSWVAGHVHERVTAERVLRLKSPIQHWPFTSISDQVQTNDRYSDLGARDLVDRGVRFSWVRLCTKPVSKFIETFFLKAGFRDGLPGLIIAVGAAYSVFLKHAKVWEMTQLRPGAMGSDSASLTDSNQDTAEISN